MTFPDDVAGRRITVMGLGRFGGGLGATRALLARGATVIVTDLDGADALQTPLDALREPIAAGRVTLRLGAHDVEDFTAVDGVAVNPAVPKPWANPFLLAARDAGVPCVTEIQLVTRALDRARIIGVTGSAGKSTTSAMIHHALRALGIDAVLGGNLGGSLLDALEDARRAAVVVLELSSAMLWWLGHDRFAPHVGVLTNLAENHLDWHGTMAHYEASKLALFDHQDPDDIAIDGRDLERSMIPPRTLALPGAHNQFNAELAVRAIRAMTDHHEPAISATLATFRGLPHRLCRLDLDDACAWYDDSKSTTPAATCLAIDAFDDASRVHLIAGGYDKGSDLTAIAARASSLAGLYTIGATGPALDAAAAGATTPCVTLDRAVMDARRAARDGDIILLSPGCASWDQFANYEARGARFAECAAEISPARRPTTSP